LLSGCKGAPPGPEQRLALYSHQQTVVEYAQSRIEDHLGSFFNLYRGLKKSAGRGLYKKREEEYGIFTQADPRLYRTEGKTGFSPGATLKVTMFSWEYPPHHVGGLGIHVRDLAEALVRRGGGPRTGTRTFGIHPRCPGKGGGPAPLPPPGEQGAAGDGFPLLGPALEPLTGFLWP